MGIVINEPSQTRASFMVSREYCLGIVTYVQKFAPGLVNLIKPLKKNKTCLEARIPWKVSSESKVMTKHQCQLKFFIVHKKTQFNMMCSWVIKIAIQWDMHLEPSLKSFWRCFSDFEREKYCKKNPPPPSNVVPPLLISQDMDFQIDSI